MGTLLATDWQAVPQNAWLCGTLLPSASQRKQAPPLGAIRKLTQSVELQISFNPSLTGAEKVKR